jgi:hypothetical protein
MNTKQKIRMNMYLAVRNYGNQNQAVTSRIPKFELSFGRLKEIITELQLIGKKQGVNKTGITVDKNKLKKALIAMAVKYSNKVAILAKLNDNSKLLNEVRLNESDLAKLSGATLKDRVQLIYDRVEANLASLEEQEVTAETQKRFLETITAFNNALATPRTGIAEKREATNRLLVLFDEADSEIEIMDLAAGSAKDDFPEFFTGYRTSRKLVETSSGSLALKATATELINGDPLSGALFRFRLESSDNGEMVKKTSKKGNFHVKSMDPGIYQVEVSKQGYKNREVSVNVEDGQRNDLIVELEKA